MQPGQVVKIYEDPLTEKKLEGEAKLIELLHQDSDREYWLVEFTRGHERHPRWIKKTKDEGERPELIKRLRNAVSKLPAFRVKWADIDKMSISELRGALQEIEKQVAPEGAPASEKLEVWWHDQAGTLVKTDEVETVAVIDPYMRFGQNRLNIRVYDWDVADRKRVGSLPHEIVLTLKRKGTHEHHHSNGSKPETLCDKLQYFIDEEEKSIAEYEELWKEIGRLGQKGYTAGIIRIVEEERSHRDTLKRIKEVMCP